MMVHYRDERLCFIGCFILAALFALCGTASADPFNFLKYTPRLAARYEGLIFPDPRDSLNVVGGVVLAEVRSHETTSCAPRALVGLKEGFLKYTGLQVVLKKRRYLNTSNIFRMPFIYFHPAELFEIEPDEAVNVAKYLYSGGFMMVDKCISGHGLGPAEESLRKMFRDALGWEARFEILPLDHPIYHSFFHFDKGPPSAGKPIKVRIPSGPSGFGRSSYFEGIPTLEGLYLGDRLVAIISDKDYGSRWLNPWLYSGIHEAEVKMGMNIVIFVLTQEGSIARWNSDNYLLDKTVENITKTIAEVEEGIEKASAEEKDTSEFEHLLKELVETKTHLVSLGESIYELERNIRRLQRELVERKVETGRNLEALLDERARLLREIKKREDFFQVRAIR